MEVKKAIRKVIALSTGASMVGATLLGAMAADLADFPSPFVKDGKFDALVVVGQDAQPEDVVGAVDVGAALQFEMRKATTVATGATEATISEGYKVQKSSNHFNYYDNINAIDTTVTEDELPELLMEQTFVDDEGNNDNEEDYEQQLLFSWDNSNLTFYQDDDDAAMAGPYIFISKSVNLYNYTLKFDNAIDYDNTSSTTAKDDIEGNVLKLQGQTYTITNVDATGAGNSLKKLTMLAGETVLWLTQDQPITKTVEGVDHTVMVLDVTESEDACLVKVDDTQVLLDEGQTKTVGGVEVGLTDARAIHSQLQDVDICEISVGASKIILETGGQEVDVNGDGVDGSKAYITGTSGDWTGLYVEYKPDDKAYLGVGQAWTDPVFNNWKIEFGGMTENFEEYTLKTSGSSDATFTFANTDGKMVEVPMSRNDTVVVFGSDMDERLLIGHELNGNVGNATCAPTSADIVDCEDVLIWAVDGEEIHILEITDIDSNNNKTTIKDLTYDREYKDKTLLIPAGKAPGNNTASTIDVGLSFNIELTASSDQLIVNQSVQTAGGNTGETKAGAVVNLTFSEVTPQINIYEQDNDELAAGTLSTIALQAYNNSADDAIGVREQSSTRVIADAIAVEEDSDDRVTVTLRGTRITDDTENKDSVVIQYSGDESYGNVFIAPISATVSEAAAGVVTYELGKINVGAARLDTEISSVTADNLIVVGGPCVNRIAAQVMGKTYPACGADSGIPQDAAMIKLYTQSTGKVSMVVAGWNAVDTRRATRVLSDPAKRASLSGSQAKVTGTSLTDITVSPMS